MNLEQFLLTKLAEECSEVAQITLKTQQFGMTEVCPQQPLTNAQRMHLEIDDFMAAVEMLNDCGLGYMPNRDRIEAKKEKVRKYLHYSRELGCVK